MLLTLAIFIPLVGGLLLLLIPDRQKALIRWMALLTSIAAFIPMVAVGVGYAKGESLPAPHALNRIAEARIATIQDPALRQQVHTLANDPEMSAAKLEQLPSTDRATVVRSPIIERMPTTLSVTVQSFR